MVSFVTGRNRLPSETHNRLSVALVVPAVGTEHSRSNRPRRTFRVKKSRSALFSGSLVSRVLRCQDREFFEGFSVPGTKKTASSCGGKANPFHGSFDINCK